LLGVTSDEAARISAVRPGLDAAPGGASFEPTRTRALEVVTTDEEEVDQTVEHHADLSRRRPSPEHGHVRQCRRRYARCVGVLREVVEADLPVFYEHQRDREAAAMAAFPPRERDAFMAHWAKTLANDSALTWTVVSDGAVAGNIGCWEDDGRRLVGYWIGREFWGRGLATQALAELLDVVDARPLHAYVAKSNVASIRVLEKCGFVKVGEHAGDDGIEELLLELRA
jgi:RimJ/RimL family protein N-acetyltransferase